jgi:serine/threonine-protein kinase RsbT
MQTLSDAISTDRCKEIEIIREEDITITRQVVRSMAQRLGFRIMEQTKLITATSELSRNMLVHAHGGRVLLEELTEQPLTGIRLSFIDTGPGIADIDLALTDGYSTVKSMGLGLPGSKRLVSDFFIESTPAVGTKVVITQWKR